MCGLGQDDQGLGCLYPRSRQRQREHVSEHGGFPCSHQGHSRHEAEDSWHQCKLNIPLNTGKGLEAVVS